jgi:hypothetical protein
MQMLFNFFKKPTPAPAATPAKGKGSKTAAPVKSVPVSSFAGGLVGSDVEAPEFDPLQLSAGASAETLSWYRAAELKVS